MTTGLKRRFLLLLWLLVLTACSTGHVADPLKPPLTSLGNIQLPKETGTPAFDLLTMDPRVGRLYVPHSSVATLEVVDVRERKLAGRVSNLPGIKAVALTSDPNIVYTSMGTGIGIVDVGGLKLSKTLTVSGTPDAIQYDRVHDVILAGVSGAKTEVAFIDPKTQTVTGTVEVPGKPELMDVNETAGLVYLAINDKNAVVAIDPVSRSITKTFKGCDIKGPTGVAYDSEEGLLFVASSPQLCVVDVVIEQCRGVVDIGKGTDQIAFNPHTHHVYTANSATKDISVVDSTTLKPLGVAGSGRGAGTMAIDPTTDRVYVMAARSGIVGVYHDP
jgi:DNA-binding beta-propeller fold protein YncE